MGGLGITDFSAISNQCFSASLAAAFICSSYYFINDTSSFDNSIILSLTNDISSRGRSDKDSTALKIPRQLLGALEMKDSSTTALFGPRIHSPSGYPPGSREDESPFKDPQTTNPGPLDDGISQTTPQDALDVAANQTTSHGPLAGSSVVSP
ncbi:hypothetical protein GEMRC1_012555 [Eukaryota sp. GEM-RC1]